jgi:hypothetical protein
MDAEAVIVRGPGAYDEAHVTAARIVIGQFKRTLARAMKRAGVERIEVDGWRFTRAADGTVRRLRVAGAWVPGPGPRRSA